MEVSVKEMVGIATILGIIGAPAQGGGCYVTTFPALLTEFLIPGRLARGWAREAFSVPRCADVQPLVGRGVCGSSAVSAPSTFQYPSPKTSGARLSCRSAGRDRSAPAFTDH